MRTTVCYPSSMLEPVRSLEGVCDVQFVRGAEAAADARPDLLFEVPHGATTARHFDELRGQLQGDYDDSLREFFFVNTDVGAPELALAVARLVVAEQPDRTALVVRCHVPRTFVDCNRRIERDAVARTSQAGELTPGLQPWVEHAADRELLLDRYFAYQEVVQAAFTAICGRGGLGLCVHTYAPRSIDVAVDDDIVASLRRAYAPERVDDWPLRPEVDLITHDPDGHDLAAVKLTSLAQAEFSSAGFEVVRNGTYSLHPATMAYAFARQYIGSTLCLELRRDLLLDEFVPFVELTPRASAVGRVAQPLARAIWLTRS